MKMNKLAAGALALALGLGAVAPAVAAETKTEVKEATGAQHFLTKYNAQLKKVNELYAKLQDAKAVEAGKLEVLKAKEAALREAVKAFDAVNGTKEIVEEIEELVANGDNYDGKAGEVKRVVEKKVYEVLRRETSSYEMLAQEAYNKIYNESATKPAYSYEYYMTKDARTREQLLEDALAAWTTPNTDNSKTDSQKENTKDELITAVKTFVNNRESLKRVKNIDKDLLRRLANKLEAAVLERNVAQDEYDLAVKATEAAQTAYDKALEELKKPAEGYNVVIQVGNNGLQVVDKNDAKVAPIKEKKADLSALRAAREEALITLQSVKLLEELAPEKIADVKDKLDALVAEQKALIEKADKVLGKKAAFIATAYADDEEVDVEELTRQLNEKSEKIQDLISDDKKEEEKPADKDEEKPADKDEEKPADKDEEKPAEKEEDKKEDKKEEANKPARRAGNNARTGIAGVAGVAGILAAASVAYAASKRD